MLKNYLKKNKSIFFKILIEIYKILIEYIELVKKKRFSGGKWV